MHAKCNSTRWQYPPSPRPCSQGLRRTSGMQCPDPGNNLAAGRRVFLRTMRSACTAQRRSLPCFHRTPGLRGWEDEYSAQLAMVACEQTRTRTMYTAHAQGALGSSKQGTLYTGKTLHLPHMCAAFMCMCLRGNPSRCGSARSREGHVHVLDTSLCTQDLTKTHPDRCDHTITGYVKWKRAAGANRANPTTTCVGAHMHAGQPSPTICWWHASSFIRQTCQCVHVCACTYIHQQPCMHALTSVHALELR